MLYRRAGAALEVLLVHPGGPFWAKREDGAWSIPKGEFEEGEHEEGDDHLACALREAEEELGIRPEGDFLDLGTVRQAGGKLVHCFAVEAEFDPAGLVSNEFEMEWPPRSGRMQRFPEIDRAAWFSPDEARQKINPAQAAFIDRLLATLGG